MSNMMYIFGKKIERGKKDMLVAEKFDRMEFEKSTEEKLCVWKVLYIIRITHFATDTQHVLTVHLRDFFAQV